MTRALIFAALLAILPASASADQLGRLLELANRTVVYLEVRDASSGVVNRGTGFVVSHTGYVVTADHLRVGPTDSLWGVVGARVGTWYPLEFREKDEANDIAVWQLPQSPVCRHAMAFSTEPMRQLDQVVAFGFPGISGLSSSVLTVQNVQTDRGFARTDGYLEGGNSGGPVLNQAGLVVAVVQSGRLPGTENNHIVPIAIARSLLQKRGVKFGEDEALEFPSDCYAECRHQNHGIERWSDERSWSRSSGWLGGGNNQRDVCANLAAAVKVEVDADYVTVTSSGEESKKDLLGRVEYKFHCAGSIMSGPLYNLARSASCGLWN